MGATYSEDNIGPANFIVAVLCLQVRTYVYYINLGFVQYWSMGIFYVATGAASSHRQCFDLLQNRIQWTCCSTFQSFSHRRDAAIIGLICRLLNGEG